MKVSMPKSARSQQNEIILALLRDRREDLRMRQADLAELLGQTQATISRVERGERRLDVVELRAWLTALDISFVSFVKQLDARLSQRPEQLLRFTAAVSPRKRRGRQ